MNTLCLLQYALILLLAGVNGIAQPNADHGLKGDYYTGTNFDRKVFSRIDPNLNFNWRGRTPGPGLDRQYYSIRWTGRLQAPVSGLYRFTVEVDDGVRVWVGNKKIIDAWELHDNITFNGSVLLEAGKTYDLRVDYFNDMLEGEIKLYWVKPNEFRSLTNSPGSILPAEFLSYKPTKPATPAATAKPVTPVVSKPAAQTVAATKPPVLVSDRGSLIRTPTSNKPPILVAKRPDPVKTPPPTTPTGPTTAKVNGPLPSVVRPSVARPSVAQPAIEKAPVTPSGFDKPTTGETVILTHVLFKQSECVLLPESYAELDKLVSTLKNQPALHVGIVGHTDNVGDQRLNQTLSEYRAKAVANYLIRHGIADERVQTKGFGGSQPLNGNATEAERIVNRRVEFMFW